VDLPGLSPDDTISTKRSEVSTFQMHEIGKLSHFSTENKSLLVFLWRDICFEPGASTLRRLRHSRWTTGPFTTKNKTLF